MTPDRLHPQVKICGVSDAAAIEACVASGVSYVGFVFFPRSPRSVTHDLARDLASSVPPGIAKVALTVDMSDAELDALLSAVPIDILQLHGRETADRVTAVKARSGLPVMKAVGIAGPDDLDALDRYGRVADMLLVDAKPPKDAALPGGNGLAFDWRLIAGRRWSVPWMLAGGLTSETVAEAVRLTGAPKVDVSSGVEAAPGVKSPGLIRAFASALG